jgi:hypothetical protein
MYEFGSLWVFFTPAAFSTPGRFGLFDFLTIAGILWVLAHTVFVIARTHNSSVEQVLLAGIAVVVPLSLRWAWLASKLPAWFG